MFQLCGLWNNILSKNKILGVDIFWELTFWEVDVLGVDIWRVDILGVDILGVDPT